MVSRLRRQRQRLLGHVPGIGAGLHAHLLRAVAQVAQVQPQLAIRALDQACTAGALAALEVAVEAVRAEQPQVIAALGIQRPALAQRHARQQRVAARHRVQPQPVVDMQHRRRAFAGQRQIHARGVDRRIDACGR
jgi:hypothetical protein